MKRFIKVTACTLVLSLLIAFGVNQNSISLGKVLAADSNTTTVDGNVTNREDIKSLASDDQTKVATNATKDTDTDKKEVTPNKVTKKAKKTGAKKVSKKKTSKAIKNNSKNNFSTINGQTIIYKGVNLSDCDSTKEVVSELQKNGYTNINMNNVKNIKALKDILAIVQNNGSTNNDTPTPTVKPTPTTKPAPTQAPAPTTKPTPTKAPIPTTKPTAPATNTGIDSYDEEVLRLVNIERSKAGLTAFTTNSTLKSAADKRAQETVQSFSHTRPNGTGFETALNEYGVSYRAAGENIAYGQKSPQEVVTGWMNSPGHRANILNGKFNKIGIGVYKTNGVIYWSQLFTD